MGQRIAIHAAKAIEKADVRGRGRHELIAAALNYPEWDRNIPRGAVVCTAVLDHAALVTGLERDGQVVAGNGHLVPVDEWGISARAAGCGFSGTWSRWTRRPRAGAARGSGIGSAAAERRTPAAMKAAMKTMIRGHPGNHPHPGYSHRQEKTP